MTTIKLDLFGSIFIKDEDNYFSYIIDGLSNMKNIKKLKLGFHMTELGDSIKNLENLANLL